MTITLRNLTSDNFDECVDLEVREDQKRFVAPNVYSLAESHFRHECVTKAIYADEEMVGFLMYCYGEDYPGTLYLMRFMIGEKHQKKGYAKEAMRQLLLQMEKEFPNQSVFLSTDPDNDYAIRFYEQFGFKCTGEYADDELIFKREAQ